MENEMTTNQNQISSKIGTVKTGKERVDFGRRASSSPRPWPSRLPSAAPRPSRPAVPAGSVQSVPDASAQGCGRFTSWPTQGNAAQSVQVVARRLPPRASRPTWPPHGARRASGCRMPTPRGVLAYLAGARRWPGQPPPQGRAGCQHAEYPWLTWRAHGVGQASPTQAMPDAATQSVLAYLRAHAVSVPIALPELGREFAQQAARIPVPELITP